MTAVGAGLLASVVCSPHVFQGDLMLLAIPLVLWARRDVGAAFSATVVLGVAAMVDSAVPQGFARFEACAMAVLFVAGAIALSFREDSPISEPLLHGSTTAL